jgi:hypothetical protein
LQCFVFGQLFAQKKGGCESFTGIFWGKNGTKLPYFKEKKKLKFARFRPVWAWKICPLSELFLNFVV